MAHGLAQVAGRWWLIEKYTMLGMTRLVLLNEDLIREIELYTSYMAQGELEEIQMPELNDALREQVRNAIRRRTDE